MPIQEPTSAHSRRSLTIDNDTFFAEVLSRIAEGKRPRLLPRGASMLPLIRGGKDPITLSGVTEDTLQPGRIVLIRIARGYIAHRIVRVEGDIITLRGDGNPYQREQCLRSEVKAEITEIHRGKHDIRLGDKRWRHFERFWPTNDTLRRVLLALYRRTLLKWGW